MLGYLKSAGFFIQVSQKANEQVSENKFLEQESKSGFRLRVAQLKA